MIKIYAIDDKTDDKTEVSDWMYWFEENGVTDIASGSGHHATYRIIIEVNGQIVYDNRAER